MTQPRVTSELSWLLDDLVERVDDVQRAVLLSRDGLVMGASRSVTRKDAEYLAALSAGFFSLANGAREHFEAGEVRQTIVEMDGALFFVVPAATGSCLAVLSKAGANAGLVAYEMAMLIKRVRRHLAAAPRSAEPDPSPPVRPVGPSAGTG